MCEMCLKCIFFLTTIKTSTHTEIKSPSRLPPKKIREDGVGQERREQGRKGLPAQWLINNGSRQSWSQRCLQYVATIKNQTRPLLVHCSETKNISSQIHINTRLQLFLLKFFHLFLQGLATLLQFLFALQQL